MFQPSVTPKDSYDITSTVNVTYDKDHCLTFWYYEDGEDPFQVKVFMQTPSYKLAANWYSSAIENRRRWNLIKSDIQFDATRQTNCKLWLPFDVQIAQGVPDETLWEPLRHHGI